MAKPASLQTLTVSTITLSTESIYSKWVFSALSVASLSNILPLFISIPMSHTLCLRLLWDRGQVQQLGFLAFLITSDPEQWHSGESKANVRRFKKSTAALEQQLSLEGSGERESQR